METRTICPIRNVGGASSILMQRSQSTGLPLNDPPAPLIDTAQVQLAIARTDAFRVEEQDATILLAGPFEFELRTLDAALSANRWRRFWANSASQLLSILDKRSVDLIVLDMALLDMPAIECCRRIRANSRSELTPILMLTTSKADQIAAAGLRSGADDFLEKPFQPETVRARVRSLLRFKSTVDRLEESETILLALAQAVEQRDHATAGHCERLALFSVALGMAMNLPRQQLLALHRGGYLHDLGKVAMPDAVLFKAGPLTENEWQMMRTHTVRGEDICRPMRCLVPVLPIIRSHHERWDGSGYPDGLKAEEIPLLARVLQMADIFDALSTARPYKPAFSVDDALRIMKQETDRGWRDPRLMELFCRLPHGLLRETAEQTAHTCQDADAMQRNLRSLRFAVDSSTDVRSPR